MLTNAYTSLHLLEPTYQPVIGYTLAFTPGAGKLTGEARIVSIGAEMRDQPLPREGR